MQYFIYVRKSSEEEERQALSIDSQLQELREFIGRSFFYYILSDLINQPPESFN